jgi:hypothetical protein
MLYAALNNTQVKHPSYKVCHNCIGIEASAGGAHASVGLEAGHIGAYDQMTPIQRFYSALVCTHVLAHAENVHLTQQTPFDHNGNHFNISSTTLDYDFPNNIATAPSITHTYPPLVSLQHFDDQLGTSIQHTHGQHFRHSAERSINILPNSWEVQGQAGTELAGIGSQFIHDEVRRD